MRGKALGGVSVRLAHKWEKSVSVLLESFVVYEGFFGSQLASSRRYRRKR